MIARFILGLLSLFLFLGAGSAGHCTTWTTSAPEIDTDPLDVTGVRWYFDNDLCQPECLFSMWFYQESNGIPGLQRGDEVKDDTCHGMIEGDTITCVMLPVAIMSRRDKKDQRGASGAALVGAAVLGATAFMPTVDAC